MNNLKGIKIIKDKNKLNLIILLLFLITIITLVTYASFNIDIKGLINIKTESPAVSITYEEAPNALIQTNKILTEEEHKISNDYFEFKVSSTSGVVYNLYYRIYLTEKETNTLSKDNLYIYLTKVNNETEIEVLSPTKVNSLKEHSTYNNSYILISNNFNFLSDSKETKEVTYRLRIWNKEASSTNNVSINGGIYEYVVNVETYNSVNNVITKDVKKTNISYKYINNANVTENGITYNNNDNGVFLYDGTDDNGGSLPIYYYRGNVTNNNVIFGNFCWKIVRTTSTGGAKLIYNGIPTNGTCNNTGEASQLEETALFNENYYSPADVGYMYGERYERKYKDMTNITDEIKYGNDVTYSNGVYKLSGKTFTSSSWSSDYETLADGYHYTCLNSTGICDKEEVYYILSFTDPSSMYYLTFTSSDIKEKDTLETVKQKMFSNVTDSEIKKNVDNWYKNNLTDYTGILENTIFCNDRTVATGTAGGSLGGKDTNSISESYFANYQRLHLLYSPSLECSNITDRFSLNENNGGTSGFGNNKLTYPVGLLTYDEAMLAGGVWATDNNNYYLYTNQDFWLISPRAWFRDVVGSGGVRSTGSISTWRPDYLLGVRPVISLKQETEIINGTVLINDPYIITENL